MVKRMTRLVSILLALMLAPLSAWAEAAPAERNAAGKPYVLNEFDGTILDVSQYKGKAIWLNFFTGWCSYCMEEMPAIKQSFDAYSPDELAIVLVHVWQGENADDSAKVVERFGLQDMIMLEDEDMALSTLVGVAGFPTSIFIDKEGYIYGGAYALDFDGMAEYLDGMGVAKLAAAATVAP